MIVDQGSVDGTVLICVLSDMKRGRKSHSRSYEACLDRMLFEHSVIDENVSWMSLFICDWCTMIRQVRKISSHFMKDGWRFSNHFLRVNLGCTVQEFLVDLFRCDIPCGRHVGNA